MSVELRTNKILARVKAGEMAVGFQIPFCAPDLVGMMGMAGCDYVFIDCEHGSFSPGEVEIMCRAAEVAGVTPIARPPSIDPPTILGLITRGAIGIIAPHIKTAAQARQLVEACLYSPQGMRSYGNSRGDYHGTLEITRENMQLVNEQMFIMAMIEEDEGFKNLPEILEVEGLDFFKFGGHDILLDMKFDDQKMAEAIQTATELIRSAGKKVETDVLSEGTVCGLFLESAKEFVAQGRAK